MSGYKSVILVFYIAVIVLLFGVSRPCRAATVEYLDTVATKILSANGYNLNGSITPDHARAGGFATIFQISEKTAMIFVDPTMLRDADLNSWAFVIGHELAHQILGHTLAPSSEESERAADKLGANLAIKAGYDLKNYIEFMYKLPNTCPRSHGCYHDRARALEQEFGLTVHVAGPECSGHHAVTRTVRIACQHLIPCQHQIPCAHRAPCSHRIACQHRMACQHRLACQHWVNTNRGPRRMHPFDTVHPFDTAHPFDTLHPFDTAHSFDVQHPFDALHASDEITVRF